MLALMIQAWSEWEKAFYERPSQRVGDAILQYWYNGTFIFQVIPLAHSSLFLSVSLVFLPLSSLSTVDEYSPQRKVRVKTIHVLPAQNLNETTSMYFDWTPCVLTRIYKEKHVQKSLYWCLHMLETLWFWKGKSRTFLASSTSIIHILVEL